MHRRKKSRKPPKLSTVLTSKASRKCFLFNWFLMGRMWGTMYVCRETSAVWATTKVMLLAGSDVTFTQQQLGSGGIWDHTSSSLTSLSPQEKKNSLYALHKVLAQLLPRQLTEQSSCISVKKKETRERGLAYTNQTGYQVTITLGEGSQRDHEQYTRAERFFLPLKEIIQYSLF